MITKSEVKSSGKGVKRRRKLVMGGGEGWVGVSWQQNSILFLFWVLKLRGWSWCYSLFRNLSHPLLPKQGKHPTMPLRMTSPPQLCGCLNWMGSLWIFWDQRRLPSTNTPGLPTLEFLWHWSNSDRPSCWHREEHNSLWTMEVSYLLHVLDNLAGTTDLLPQSAVQMCTSMQNSRDN